MPLTFGEAMLELLKKRGLSATAVAEELGFKSRTAFFRILHDESRMLSIQKCFEAVKGSALLALSKEETDALVEAMQVSLLGKQTYGIHRVLHQMIYPADNRERNADIEIVGIEGIRTIDDVISLIPKGGRINIMMAGRSSKYIVDRIHRLTQERKVERITHLFAIDEEDAEDVKVFSCISDILFSSVYSAYYLIETGTGKKNWWLRSGVVMFDHTAENGERKTVQITWLNRNRYFCLTAQNDSGMVFWRSLFENHDEELIPLKKEAVMDQAEPAPDLERYIAFTDEYRKLESSRAIYTIKQDFPINCVPVDILAPMVIKTYYSSFAEESKETNEQIRRLYGIHEARSSNIYNRKKPVHFVLSPKAMMEFARTGQRSDHFFLGRPYTVEERVRLLTLLRDQTRDNPNFNIWMMKNADIVDDKEVTVYDGYGVAMVKADTSWCLEQDHQEVMLESRMLAKHFKSYFVSSLLTSSVMSREESIAMLDEIIEAARNA